jgi:hypothetical protein
MPRYQQPVVKPVVLEEGQELNISNNLHHHHNQQEQPYLPQQPHLPVDIEWDKV